MRLQLMLMREKGKSVSENTGLICLEVHNFFCESGKLLSLHCRLHTEYLA
jgi:hypothetical protein